MKMPKQRSIRLSDDVWQIAIDHAKAEGLGSPRDAVERMIRLFSRGSTPSSPQVEVQS